MYRTTPFFTTKSTAPTIAVGAASSTASLNPDVQSCSVSMSTNCSATKGLFVPSFTYAKGSKGGRGGGGRLNRTNVTQSGQLIGSDRPETCWAKLSRVLGGETTVASAPLVTEESSNTWGSSGGSNIFTSGNLRLVDGVGINNGGDEVGTVLIYPACSPPPLLSPTPAERLELSLLLALLHDFSLCSLEEGRAKDESGRSSGGGRDSSNGGKNSNTTATATSSATMATSSATIATTGNTSSATCVRPTHTTDELVNVPSYVREWVEGMGVPFRSNSSSTSFSMQTSSTASSQPQPIRDRPHPQPRHTNINNINSSINPQAGRIYCLKHYNSVKDAAQHMFGLVAQSRGIELSQLYFEEGISDE